MELTGLQEIIKTDTNITLPEVRGKIQSVYNTAESDTITVSYGGATLDLEAGEGADILYDGSAWYVNALMTSIGISAIDYTSTDLVITTQEEFEALFSTTVDDNTSIYIKKMDTPYILNHEVILGSGVRITSDGAVINRGTVTARFVTTYRNLTTDFSGGAVGDTTITRTAGTPFEAGDLISWNGEEFYTVVSDSTTTETGGTVTVSPAIHDTAAGGTIYAYTQNIHTEGWTFDGQNNVNGMGGSYTSGFTGSGGAFYIPYCANSRFLAGMRNCRATSAGGAYYGAGATYNNTMANIDNCSATLNGGACSGCQFFTISDIDNCSASESGGACHDCNYSTISRISNCSASLDGGGCSDCNYSTISNIRECNASLNGGGCSGCEYSTISLIHNCNTASNGGGCSGCNYSTISNIRECNASLNGGGCSGCEYSTISHIFNCSASSNGGGCYGCEYSTISHIFNCSASSNGGGCYDCNYSHISIIGNCTAPTDVTDAAGGVANSTSLILQGIFASNEGYINNVGGCTYTGQFILSYGDENYTTVTTAAGLSSDDYD